MKNLLISSVLAIVMLSLVSCGEKTKQTAEDLGKKIDTLTKNVGKEIDTLASNITKGGDSLFNSVKILDADTATIAAENFRNSLNGVFKDYLDVKDALVDNDSADASLQANQLKKTLAAVKLDGLKDKLKSGWAGSVAKLNKAADNVAATNDLNKQRTAFAELTEAMTSLIKTYGLDNKVVYRIYCAGAKGGYWLVDSKNTDNPYVNVNTTAGTKDGSAPKDGTKSNDTKNCAEVKEAWSFKN